MVMAPLSWVLVVLGLLVGALAAADAELMDASVAQNIPNTSNNGRM